MEKKQLILKLIIGLVCSTGIHAQTSLYRDIKANRVGDVITVILQESTSGSSTADKDAASTTDGSATGSVSGNFLPFEPVFGSGATVNFGSNQRNNSVQRQLLQGFISVQIKEVTPSGSLIVEGSRQTEVNGEVHEMSLSGIVRPIDVNGMNEVLSYRIANANISYHKKGGLKGNKKDRGRLRKIAFGALSLGLGAAIIMNQTDG
ncbi:MAG: flagellar basal body L-ring protein FlgH [Bacteroidota bacterium]